MVPVELRWRRMVLLQSLPLVPRQGKRVLDSVGRDRAEQVLAP